MSMNMADNFDRRPPACYNPAMEGTTMIPKELVDRINALARKSREEGLTECEKAEQQVLRAEYLTAIKARVQDAVDHTVVEAPNGARHKIERK